MNPILWWFTATCNKKPEYQILCKQCLSKRLRNLCDGDASVAKTQRRSRVAC